MEKRKYHLPQIKSMYSNALCSVMQRHEDALNTAIDGRRELWGLSPAELLKSRQLPHAFAQEIRYYASALFCFEFFINSLRSDCEGIQIPKDELASLMKRDIGSFEEFCYRFLTMGREHSGVGFMWLIFERGRVLLTTTQNYNMPRGLPLLCFSLWENAYIENYSDRRDAYLSECLRLCNWEYAQNNLKREKI